MLPSYISNLLSINSCYVYFLRSNSSLFLDHPKRRMLSTLHAVTPTLWNSLPANIREITPPEICLILHILLSLIH